MVDKNTKQKQKELTVYVAYDKKNCMVYIGSTVNGLDQRKRAHYHNARHKKNNTHFYNALRARPKDFDWGVLEVSTTYYDETIDGFNRDREQYWIDLYWGSPVLYNTKRNVRGGTGHSGGRKRSATTKTRISKALTGRTFSDEHRKNLSKSQKGRIISKEVRQRMSEAHVGITHTEETKQKIREASTGRVKSEEERKKISESRKGEKHPFYGKSFTEDHRKNLSKAQSGESAHNYGKPPWEAYKKESVLIVWRNADAIYDYWNKTKASFWGIFCEFKGLGRPSSAFRKIHGKFVNGWNPYEDDSWKAFKLRETTKGSETV